VPTLYTVLSAGSQATDPTIYGTYTHPFVLAHDQVVEILVNNLDTGKHPFHLHGHNFQVVWRSDDDAGTFADSNVTSDSFPAIPMRRDTVVLRPQGNLVLRFKSDNPGVWLFHCHIEWHVESGLMATMVEAPLEMQKSITVPAEHFQVCEAAGMPTAGNAAANTVDLLDLGGQNAPPSPLPDGYVSSLSPFLLFCPFSLCAPFSSLPLSQPPFLHLPFPALFLPLRGLT
jgi:iron transport multicopper oxidase